MGATRPASPTSIIIIAEDCWVKRVFRTFSRLHPGVPSGCVFHFRLSSLPPPKKRSAPFHRCAGRLLSFLPGFEAFSGFYVWPSAHGSMVRISRPSRLPAIYMLTFCRLHKVQILYNSVQLAKHLLRARALGAAERFLQRSRPLPRAMECSRRSMCPLWWSRCCLQLVRRARPRGEALGATRVMSSPKFMVPSSSVSESNFLRRAMCGRTFWGRPTAY